MLTGGVDIMDILKSLIINKSLILIMTKREILGRYNGSILGVAWSFVNPLIMLCVYGFVFGLVFKARWGAAEVEHNFAVILFSGLIFHSLLAESLTRGPFLIVGNVNFVKKVVFPLEALAWVALFSALFHFVVSAFILVVVQFTLSGFIPWTWVYLPFVLAPLFFLCLGLNWILSSLGVYLRDIGQITSVLTVIFLFLCPIFYPLDVIPEQYQIFILLNPLSFLVEQARQILVFGNSPDFVNLVLYTAVTFIIAQLSLKWFSRTKKGFADVL